MTILKLTAAVVFFPVVLAMGIWMVVTGRDLDMGVFWK